MPALQKTSALQELTGKVTFPVQDQMAAGQILRQQAVAHLLARDPYSQVSQQFWADESISHVEYLAQQSLPSTHGDHYMLAALAELYQVNVTVVQKGHAQPYKAADYGDGFPTITMLYNEAAATLDAPCAKTLHFGACLFNSFALGLSQLFAGNDSVISIAPKSNEGTLNAWRQMVLQSQHQALASFTPKEEDSAQAAPKVLDPLDPIAQQIKADEELAWQLAEEEYRSTRPRIDR